MLLKHAAMFLVLIACLSTGMTSAFAVEIPQVRNHAPTVVGVNVSFAAGDNTPTLAAAAFVETGDALFRRGHPLARPCASTGCCSRLPLPLLISKVRFTV